MTAPAARAATALPHPRSWSGLAQCTRFALFRYLPSGIARRFARALVGLVTIALVATGAADTWLAYTRATNSALDAQLDKALVAAGRVAQFIGEIESQMGWTTRAEWALNRPDERRYDFVRLLRQAPAINEVQFIDGQGREQLRLSRLKPDVIGSGADLSSMPQFVEAVRDRIWYGPIYFRRGSEPYMVLSMAHAGRKPGVTSANVNLKLIWDVVAAIRAGRSGYAYVTDATGQLIAHPDMSLVLRGTDLSRLPQVAQALQAGANSSGISGQLVAGPDGRTVLSAYSHVPKLNWFVFVELPQREVVASVVGTLYQTLVLLALSILLALLLGAWLARRMVVPIRQLQAGAQRLGEGDLGLRIAVTSKDEIGALAQRFNQMAARIQEAQETLEAKVADRTFDLARSLDELRATQDRLVQTEKLASLGQLTAGIAHEIKNPLNFVNNFADLTMELTQELTDALAAGETELDPRLREDIAELSAMIRGNLTKVVQHGRRADSIVRNMLAHSRESSGELRDVDLNAMADEALNLAYHGARAERPGFNIVLERDFDPAVGRVELYPQEFTRVLLNLIGNGFYAVHKKRLQDPSEDYQPTLRLATRALPNRVEIRVYDNGTGIPDAVRARMFEPFFTTKPAGEGTGLGLSLSHDIIVKQHGGAIQVTTEPGRFTELVITLPRTAPPTGSAA
ncbi:HAMP domain-containing protein [Siccirubricoccus sp. KC 17139]|uniref:histidine kinase n=1 Tax=Siccirubricoccus soli TaxID=2899147 RepID=A0ABT1CZM6_9PROT|nr:ATP-binding protein [Siccirubricoccus soli]MCO6415099.1 HAMP domain-containing protein [Siccirubricoccus soli]MCP2681230.1 HAMP domain-containing protein [Siccirubricoccus soli]